LLILVIVSSAFSTGLTFGHLAPLGALSLILRCPSNWGNSIIEQAIKVFDPNIDLRSLKPKKMKGQCRFFKRGEATTLLMDLIRVADKLLSTTEIVNESARRKELSFDDIDRRTFTASIF